MHPRLRTATTSPPCRTNRLNLKKNENEKCTKAALDTIHSDIQSLSSPPHHLQSIITYHETIMSHYIRLAPFMDPNVFRSSSHSSHNARHGSLAPRQATIDLSRSLYRDDYFREPLDRQGTLHFDSYISHDCGSDRRHHDQLTSSSQDIDDLVRRYALLER
jgi:hypothetical protein